MPRKHFVVFFKKARLWPGYGWQITTQRINPNLFLHKLPSDQNHRFGFCELNYRAQSRRSQFFLLLRHSLATLTQIPEIDCDLNFHFLWLRIAGDEADLEKLGPVCLILLFFCIELVGMSGAMVWLAVHGTTTKSFFYQALYSLAFLSFHFFEQLNRKIFLLSLFFLGSVVS